MANSALLNKALNYLDQNQEMALQKLFELLRIPSISTNKKHSNDCKLAADWLKKEFSEMGFNAEIKHAPGHPMVLANYPGQGPHFLFYGHYDVQPIDPVDLWNHNPFEPKIENTPSGKIIRARGASDDKGQVMTFIEACRAYLKTSGTLPCQISILIEGEEEIGSPSMENFLKENSKQLSADYALVCDTGMWNAKTPAITTMLRGMVGDEILITASNRDLHSGMYGGVAVNPIHLISKILSDLHDINGRVTLEGFYDQVNEVPKSQKKECTIQYNLPYKE